MIGYRISILKQRRRPFGIAEALEAPEYAVDIQSGSILDEPPPTSTLQCSPRFFPKNVVNILKGLFKHSAPVPTRPSDRPDQLTCTPSIPRFAGMYR